MSENCGTCRYSDVEWTHNGKQHKCRRRSPRGEKMVGWSNKDFAVWPIVSEEDWCGEYEKGATEAAP